MPTAKLIEYSALATSLTAADQARADAVAAGTEARQAAADAQVTVEAQVSRVETTITEQKSRVDTAVVQANLAASTAESASVQALLAGGHIQHVKDDKSRLDGTPAAVGELGLALDTMTLYRVEDGQGWVQKSQTPAPWSAPRNRVKNVTLAQLKAGGLDPEGASILADEHGPLRVVSIADYPPSGYLPEHNGGTSFDLGNGLRAVRPNWRFLNVREFGAWGNGLENDSAAFRKAMAVANATVGGHVAIGVPIGKYNVPDWNDIVTRENIVLMGEHEHNTKIIPHSGTMLTLRADNFGAYNLAFDYQPDPSMSAAADALLFQLEGRSGKSRFRYLNINGSMRSFVIGSEQGRSNSNFIQDVFFAVANSGVPTIDIYDGDGQTITDINGFVIGSLPPVGNNPMTTLEGTTFLRAANKTCDTVQMSRVFLERFSRFIDIGLQSHIVIDEKGVEHNVPYYALNWQLQQVLCDYFRHEWIRFAPQGGVAAGWQVDDYYGTAWEADGILFAGNGGFAGEMQFQNGRVMLCGRSGVKIVNPATRDISIGSTRVYATDRFQEGNAAVTIWDNCGGLTMHDSDINMDASAFGPNFRSNYGVAIGPNADNYDFSNGVRSNGKIAGWFVDQNSAGSKNRRITGNLPSSSYAGIKSGAGYAMPASGAVFTNTRPYVLQVYIAHGTGRVSAVEIDGNNIGLTEGQYELQPGSTLKPTYTSGATWVVYAKP